MRNLQFFMPSTGNALARVQRVHKPAHLWDITFCTHNFEASSTMCTRCFETQSSPGCTCNRRSKFLAHSLPRDNRPVTLFDGVEEIDLCKQCFYDLKNYEDTAEHFDRHHATFFSKKSCTVM